MVCGKRVFDEFDRLPLHSALNDGRMERRAKKVREKGHRRATKTRAGAAAAEAAMCLINKVATAQENGN